MHVHYYFKCVKMYVHLACPGNPYYDDDDANYNKVITSNYNRPSADKGMLMV